MARGDWPMACWPVVIGSFPIDAENAYIKPFPSASIRQMNFLVLSALSILSLFASSLSALTWLRFCTRPGFIRSSHRHQFHWHRVPHFRKYDKPVKPADPDTVQDVENVFHLLKGLPNDCFTYVSILKPPHLLLIPYLLHVARRRVYLRVLSHGKCPSNRSNRHKQSA